MLMRSEYNESFILFTSYRIFLEGRKLSMMMERISLHENKLNVNVNGELANGEQRTLGFMI